MSSQEHQGLTACTITFAGIGVRAIFCDESEHVWDKRCMLKCNHATAQWALLHAVTVCLYMQMNCTKALSLPVKCPLDACNASAALVHTMCTHRHGACNCHQAAVAAGAQTSRRSYFDVRCLAHAHNAVCIPSIHIMTCM